MLYENYQNKILRLAEKIRKFLRILPWIIAALVAAAVATGALLAAKGTISGFKASPSIEYGNNPDVSASAFLSSVRFEYSPKGEGAWSEDVPVMPGEYDVRAVSDAAFGLSRQSKALSFTITKKQVSVHVLSSTVEYGQMPKISANICATDRMICEGVIYDDISKTETTIMADISKIKIVDSNGSDVTSAYDISTPESNVTITPHEITIYVQDATHEYDGKEFKYEIYELADGSLALGDVLQAKFKQSLVDVGSVLNVPTVSIVTAGGFDVTHHYRINEREIGNLTVTKRPLIITTGSAESVYSGASLYCAQYSVSEDTPLLDGHEIICTDASFISTVGTVPNSMVFRIVDKATGNDVTENYSIIVNQGTLKITPRPITVTTESASWKYDGFNHSHGKYTVEGLQTGHSHKLVSAQQILNAGKAENVIRVSIMAGTRDITSNYDMTYVYGTLEVTKRNITVTTGSQAWVYDAEAHQCFDGEISRDGVAKDQEVVVSQVHASSITNVGSIKNVFVVTIFYNQTDVTNNYNILYSYGTLRVTPRPITVCPSDASKIYDGTPLYASEAQVVEGSLASPTHSLQATFAGSRTNVYDTGASRVSSLEIWENGDTKVTKNYTVTLIGGSLNIDPRPIKITSDSAEKIYDGKPLTCKTFSVVVDEKNQYDLVEGHTIRGTASGSQTKIGKSDNVYSASSVKIYNGSTNVTANYIFAETAYGTLEVKPIGYLVITAASDSKVYDGKPLTNSQFTVTVVEGEILNGHSVTATVKGSITEVGKKDNVVVSAIVRNASGSNVTDGYIISTVNGVLEVLDGTGGSGGSGGSGGAGSDSSESGPPGGGEDEGDHKIVVGKIKTDISTTLYLRENSYGVYNFSANGNGGFWKASPSYAALLDGKYGYNYLTSFAMANSGAQSHTAEFSDMLAYMLPYYIGIGGTYTVPTTDTAYSTISKTAYSLKYYTVDGIYSNLSAMKGSLGSYSDEEQKYRAFVYSTYLDIDSETLAYMQSIITQQGFDVSDKHVIEKVAKYIQGAAKYNLKYDKNLDRETNVAIAFLNEYKEGVCVHYATAGTLLFRALGIPARYVEGFTVDTKANEFVDITTPGHAWVEIYIDSIGWIPVEVTGGYDGLGGSSGNGGSGGDMEDMLPHEFEIQPYSYSKEYDGKPLYPGNEIEEYGNLKILLDAGYTYTVSLSGKQTSVGSSPCKVASFVLFDPEGKDVTNEFAITYLESTLKVSRHLVKVYLYEITKYYDGKLLEIGRDDYEVISGLPDGGELVLSLHLPSADVCEITRSELNTNMSEYISYTIYENGKDVSTQYDISFEIYPGLTSKYVPISILACPITITSSSATKVYDGKALTSSAISITVGTLVDGHVLAGCANGSAIAVGSQYNTIQYDSVNITDKNGNDMTDNYDIIFALGKLTILDAD